MESKFNKDRFIYYFIDGLRSILKKDIYTENVVLEYTAFYCMSACKNFEDSPDYTELLIIAQNQIENFEICYGLEVFYKPAILQ